MIYSSFSAIVAVIATALRDMATPAYTAVAARQTLQPAQSEQAQPNRWTPEVRDYVQRSFAHDIPGVTMEEAQNKMMDILGAAASAGTLTSIDWSRYPLPQHLILLERQAPSGLVAPALGSLSLQNSYVAATAASDTNPSSVTLGKRKSGDFDTESAGQTGGTPPWKKQATKLGLEARITGKSKAEKKKQSLQSPVSANDDTLARRRERFGHVSTEPTQYVFDAEPKSQGPVVGLSQTLEKRYFRLTSAPKPAEVRPLPVLKSMMTLLRKKWKSEHNYTYACDQFKSLRQDLTVQHIKNEFTVQVYEAHARIALEMGDLGEYNQCQTQLRALYKMKLGGRPEEFTAYRILYFIFTCNRADMNNALADLTEVDKRTDGVRHALQVRAALAVGNYHKFFRLYQETPFMGAYLLDKCIDRERLAALATICKALVRFY